MSEGKDVAANYLFTDKLLQLLAELPGTEKKDDEVIAEFIDKRVIPSMRGNFLKLSKQEQYYIALFDQFSDDQLRDIQNNLSSYLPGEKRAHVLGGHKVKKYIFGLLVFVERQIK